MVHPTPLEFPWLSGGAKTMHGAADTSYGVQKIFLSLYKGGRHFLKTSLTNEGIQNNPHQVVWPFRSLSTEK